MSAEPVVSIKRSLDAELDAILNQFQQCHRLDHAHERLKEVLHEKLMDHGFANSQLRLLEVNLFGSLSGWMEFMLEEQGQGRDAVADFARHLRRAFISHCRSEEVGPQVAVGMAIELANQLMDLAANFQRHMHLEDEETFTEES